MGGIWWHHLGVTDLGHTARLREVVNSLERFGDGDRYEPGPTIFARKPWTADSLAIVLQEDAVEGVAPSQPSFFYFLEVEIAKEVIRVWSSWRGGAEPTAEQATRAVLHYAEHDAYEPLE